MLPSSVCGAALLAGRTEIQQRARTLLLHRLLSPAPPAPPPEATPAAAPEPVRRASAVVAPVPALHRVAAATLTAAATHVFLASTTEKRGRPVHTPLPPRVPGISGHRDFELAWEKVLRMCRKALLEFGEESPPATESSSEGAPPRHTSSCRTTCIVTTYRAPLLYVVTFVS